MIILEISARQENLNMIKDMSYSSKIEFGTALFCYYNSLSAFEEIGFDHPRQSTVVTACYFDVGAKKFSRLEWFCDGKKHNRNHKESWNFVIVAKEFVAAGIFVPPENLNHLFAMHMKDCKEN